MLHRIDMAAPGEIEVDAPMITAYYRLRKKVERLSAMLFYPDLQLHFRDRRHPARDESDDVA